MAQVYRRVRLLVSPTIVGVQLTDQQRTAQAPRPDLGRLNAPYEVASLRVEGVSMSATARGTGPSRHTIARWLERASPAAKRVN